MRRPEPMDDPDRVRWTRAHAAEPTWAWVEMSRFQVHTLSTCMVRTIPGTDEAYAELAKRKKHSRDSFTKVILRMAGRGGDPLAAAGAWKRSPDQPTTLVIA